eukprot:TRINITY_DN2824_c0_g1_i3.p1 TRINITY_DN2824_c0_g1~~TRINITY_DN2824_c0_g1_i3.p1  ORF type:complete len:586 (+),score=196.62 TRINITY_DN2824_c0_g1_i3:1144-2901(+)
MYSGFQRRRRRRARGRRRKRRCSDRWDGKENESGLMGVHSKSMPSRITHGPKTKKKQNQQRKETHKFSISHLFSNDSIAPINHCTHIYTHTQKRISHTRDLHTHQTQKHNLHKITKNLHEKKKMSQTTPSKPALRASYNTTSVTKQDEDRLAATAKSMAELHRLYMKHPDLDPSGKYARLAKAQKRKSKKPKKSAEDCLSPKIQGIEASPRKHRKASTRKSIFLTAKDLSFFRRNHHKDESEHEQEDNEAEGSERRSGFKKSKGYDAKMAEQMLSPKKESNSTSQDNKAEEEDLEAIQAQIAELQKKLSALKSKKTPVKGPPVAPPPPPKSFILGTGATVGRQGGLGGVLGGSTPQTQPSPMTPNNANSRPSMKDLFSPLNQSMDGSCLMSPSSILVKRSAKKKPPMGAKPAAGSDRINLSEVIGPNVTKSLRKSNIPRSPGGTPLKTGYVASNPDSQTEMLRAALQRKFQAEMMSPGSEVSELDDSFASFGSPTPKKSVVVEQQENSGDNQQQQQQQPQVAKKQLAFVPEDEESDADSDSSDDDSSSSDDSSDSEDEEEFVPTTPPSENKTVLQSVVSPQSIRV